MRNEETIINGLIQGFHGIEQKISQIVQFVSNLQQAVRLDSTGKEIRLLGIQRLLIKKQIATEIEFTNFVDKLILVLASKLALTDDEIIALKTELKLSLIKSSLITEAELTEESGKVIKEMQEQAEAAAKEAAEATAKPEIIKPTTEQVQQVTNAPVTEETVKEVVPPVQA